MKFDMHCHVKEGSIDAKVSLEEYIDRLMDKGFQGMLVTDHDTYDGYRKWKYELKNDDRYKDFVVIKGIEYDTRDAGHMLIIMPDHLKLRVLEVRGLPIQTLIDVIHKSGGIIGPAHPCGERFLSMMSTGRFRKNDHLVEKFDFIETFNSCESDESNRRARALAEKYHKPQFGGSDAHKLDCAGLAYTRIDADIRSANDLIHAVQEHKVVSCGSTYYKFTTKQKLGKLNNIPVAAFYFYNKSASLIKTNKRNKKLIEHLLLR
ncbi:CehA/McbA family metallohydrolase [Lachnospiraceae bacterium ASD3451]|uniref:PHP domain-containing protein n=1 Tax=Diplocloster agilis TaxID=2850323 RepID=UPI001DBBA394|nr:CehA/McbA family metallohydrolase [Diplocloster agilis]MBU9745391.1 CehA/McbA family metallohydrolase [Diplocloster agilis]